MKFNPPNKTPPKTILVIRYGCVNCGHKKHIWNADPDNTPFCSQCHTRMIIKEMYCRSFVSRTESERAAVQAAWEKLTVGAHVTDPSTT